MRKTAITLTALSLISALAVTAPMQAEAHDWGRGGWDRDGSREHAWRHDDRGAAIALGIFGSVLAGVAIASSQHAYGSGYYYPGYSSPYGYAGYGYYR
jgi:hypothetical protein